MGTILLVVLVLLCVGAFPTWSHSRRRGYFPGGLGLILLILLILIFAGRL